MIKNKITTQIKLYTSYYGNYSNLGEYQCISISNTKPQGINIPVWKEVAPPWALIKELKQNKINTIDFARTYYTLLSTKHPEEFIEKLSKYKSPIVLLCWEKEYKCCHRSLLAAFLWYKCGIYSSELDSFDVMMSPEQFEHLT